MDAKQCCLTSSAPKPSCHHTVEGGHPRCTFLFILLSLILRHFDAPIKSQACLVEQVLPPLVMQRVATTHTMGGRSDSPGSPAASGVPCRSARSHTRILQVIAACRTSVNDQRLQSLKLVFYICASFWSIVRSGMHLRRLS